MADPDSLADAISRLSLASKSVHDSNFSIDAILHQEQPRKRAKPSPAELIRNLEAKFLTPSPQLSEAWLNRLQQRWDAPLEYTDLVELAPTQTRTITRFTREGLEGRVTGYKEITVPASSATAKNSTSILRKPATRAEFVRGGSGFFPFAPGGLDGIENVAQLEDEALAQQNLGQTRKSAGLDKVISIGKEGGLLEIPPGFGRGLDFAKRQKVDQKTEAEVENTLEEEPEPVGEDAQKEPTATDRKTDDGNQTEEPAEDGDEDIDALLPVEFPALAPRGALTASSSKLAGKEWAHMVDVNREITNFRELVPDMAREWPFELDTFQKEAVYHLETGDSVFVAAHTSAGKTVVAEYAIALAAQHKTKAIYTSPIKALSNQKFRDFKNEFDDVGILTGDVQINPEASCLIMTTEILRSMLYRGADIIRDVEFVIFDEVHYVNDTERGVVWEEVIIMLPEHVTLILLSATVPNTKEFASWVGRTKKKDIYVISTPKRPVPLEHYLWAGKDMYKIVTAEKQFIESGWKSANDAITGRDKVKQTTQDSSQGGNSRGGQRGNQRGGPQRGGGNQRGGPQTRGGPTNRGRGNIARTGRGGGRTTAAQDRNLWVHVVQHLHKKDLLPACIFVFSKKRCEENADALSNQDFCNASEKSAIHMIIEKSLARLKPEDRSLPQIRKLRELLSRGIAVHHGGMLPIVKEVVEILFARTLVKVLFATETFAMGLNLPTRTVVFSGFRKYDSKAFRDLLPGEYTQMAGRAGRRGLDSVGNVIIVAPGMDEAPPVQRLRQMILGDPTKLRSQFRLTYNMILNLLRVEALKIEEMIKRSFSENATQALLPEHERDIKITEDSLEKIKRKPCDICDVDLKECHQACMDYVEVTKELHLATLASPVGRRTWAPRRIIVYKRDGVRTVGMLMREGTSRGADPVVTVLTISNSKKRGPSDALPYLPTFADQFAPLESNPKQMPLRVEPIPLTDVESVTETIVKIDTSAVLKKTPEALKLAKEQFVPMCTSWNYNDWDEVAWEKVRDVSFREILDKRRELASKMQGYVCRQCPTFLEHYTMQHDEWLLTEKIAELQKQMSDQNLQLLPDYEQRISVLKDLGFIDENERVELKGKVACEIHSADELVLTELVLENVLAEYEPEEIVALLSAFVFQEKTDTEPQLTANLERGSKKIIEIAEKVNNIQTLHQVIQSSDDSNDFESRPRFGMVEVVYEWARGMSFNRITDLTDVMEGTIVRVITRLDETCREVKNAARIIGDPSLYQKMQTCQEMIKRDICATASLYM